MAGARKMGPGPEANRLLKIIETMNAYDYVILEGPITATKAIGQNLYDILANGAEAGGG